ncbi:MAG: CDP-alcohol phosphatidyltransferase family protein [Candidatus Eutrophobiaceae bacterium]
MPLDARLALKCVQSLQHSSITPNHLTTLRLAFGLLASLGLATGEYLYANLGALCFAISSFLDHADGELARISGKSSRIGHYYDLISDAVVNILLFLGVGIGVALAADALYPVLLGLLSGISVATIFHIRNKMEKIVGHNDARQPHIGAVEAEDVLYLLPLVTLLNGQLWFLYLASVGAPLFTLWSIHEYLQVRKEAEQ